MYAATDLLNGPFVNALFDDFEWRQIGLRDTLLRRYVLLCPNGQPFYVFYPRG